jgi:hypothetical protein
MLDRTLPLLLVVLACTAAACTPGAPPPALPLHATIGAAGGVLQVGNGEVSLTVPVGALAGDVVISVTTGQSAPLQGFAAVGIPYLFAPTATTFAVAAQLVLPFDPTLVPPVVSSSEVRVGFRAADGTVAVIVPTFTDTASVSCDTRSLGTFWVIAPDVVAASLLLPLANNDVYHFENGVTLTVQRTTTEPNLSGQSVARLTIDDNGDQTGLYFSVASGALHLLGSFTGTARQEIFDAAVLLVDARDDVGIRRPEATTFLGYEPFGAPAASYQGIAAVTTSLPGHAQIRGPLGLFDTVQVGIENETSNTRGVHSDQRLVLWCASGAGPVLLQFDDAEPLHLLDATVSGRPVHGR